MKTVIGKTHFFARSAICAALGFALITGAASVSHAQEKSSEFASTTFDLGVVVSDIEESVDFYTKALGFKELQGFKVGSDFCKEAGLTKGPPLDIKVLALGKEASATHLKLMEVPEVKSKKAKTQYVHSQLGYSYITIEVTNLKKTLARAEAHGVEPIAKGPVQLPEGFPRHLYLAVVRDPDGNPVELIGPLK